MHQTIRRYDVQVMEVLSGDDMVLMVDLGVDGLFKKVRARLHKVDTPDAFRSSPESEAQAVRRDVLALISGKTCYVDVHSSKKSGWIVTLYTESAENGDDTVCVNTYLTGMGYIYKTGRPYNGENTR